MILGFLIAGHSLTLFLSEIRVDLIPQKESGPSGDRTHDLQIISLALYQLSYRTILADMPTLSPFHILVHTDHFLQSDIGQFAHPIIPKLVSGCILQLTNLVSNIKIKTNHIKLYL